MEDLVERLGQVIERLGRVEATLTLLVQQRTVKDWYEVEEVAHVLGKAPFTVREWCRLGRIKAVKRNSGRGAFPAWVISHEELLRYQRQGLLPLEKRARRAAVPVVAGPHEGPRREVTESDTPRYAPQGE